ncbi:hypothetical protein C483_18488 [Natrialba hulunbeirensis JCM 10989]|uniref:DUF1616 domain-containing protein n=1 Tax=Natrialba hulunbeirensis JCM 10989 TaxID=1227493 RepID=L9ZP15_9EURY|nr:DUF1616 domain-containing protein [Natrialba hulunbeirensis]ELY87307.1 hypothetical protein C483_18488 [Natrialba hulunbeirensis JCM 10989]
MSEPVEWWITDAYMKEILDLDTQPFATVGRGTRAVARLPTDLVGIAGVAIVAALLLLIVDVSSPVLRAAVGFPLLFVAPGYAAVSVLFPRESPPSETVATPLFGQTLTVTGVERAALAFGLSVALLPLFGIVIALTPYSFSSVAVVALISGFVLVCAFLAGIRRVRIPEQNRYEFSFARAYDTVHAALFGTDSAVHTAVNLLLVASMLIALSSVGYALVSPQDGEQYTELQLLTEDDDGELVATDYETTTAPNESVSLAIDLENQEQSEQAYTAVVQEQWVDDGEVLDRLEHDRLEYTLADGESTQDEMSMTPEAESGTVRVAVLLYDESVPESPTIENADRSTYLWVTVDAADSDAVGGDADGAEDDEDDSDDDEDDDDDDDSDDSDD